MRAAISDTPWQRAIVKGTDSAPTAPKEKHVEGTKRQREQHRERER
jgi:hypothetical protein